MCFERIAIVGANVRHVALSATRAGFRVWAFDGFLDRDLLAMCEQAFDFEDMGTALTRADALVKEGVCDCLLVASGIETHPIPGGVRMPLNPPLDAIRRAADKCGLFWVLSELDIPTPELLTPQHAHYPAVVKPRFGAGGRDVTVVYSDEQLRRAMRAIASTGAEPIVQQLVEGVRISASVVATRDGAKTVCLNEQLCGEPFLHAPHLRYCGNISPISCHRQRRIERLAELVCEELGLLGSCGVDFVVGDEPWVIEVNPRFQGSLDTVEEALGVSIFRAHVDAILGREIKLATSRSGVWARGIYHTPVDVVVGDEPFFYEGLKSGTLRDVPRVGTHMPEGEPLVSLMAHGSSREQAMRRLMELSAHVDALVGFI